jgi:hypothetical protein
MRYHAYEMTTKRNFDNARNCVNPHLLQSAFEWTATVTFQSLTAECSDDTPARAQQRAIDAFHAHCDRFPNTPSVVRYEQLVNSRKHELELREQRQESKRPRRTHTLP